MKCVKWLGLVIVVLGLGGVVAGCGMSQLLGEIANKNDLSKGITELSTHWFVSESHPDGWNFRSNESFTKRWTLRNISTTTWRGYRFVFVSGASLGASSPVTVPNTLPNATVDLNVPMRAPSVNSNPIPTGCSKIDVGSTSRWGWGTNRGTQPRLECEGIWELQNASGQRVYRVWIRLGVDDTWGAEIGSHNGVRAYSNGTYTGSGWPSNRGSFGFLYQCVEYVKRYYNASNWTGHAYQYWDNALGWNLDRYSNGQTLTPPQAGDILVFNTSTGGGFGHVSIVTSVRLPSGNQAGSVAIIDQNRSATDPRFSYSLTRDANGNYRIANSALIGWLRRR